MPALTPPADQAADPLTGPVPSGVTGPAVTDGRLAGAVLDALPSWAEASGTAVVTAVPQDPPDGGA